MGRTEGREHHSDFYRKLGGSYESKNENNNIGSNAFSTF